MIQKSARFVARLKTNSLLKSAISVISGTGDKVNKKIKAKVPFYRLLFKKLSVFSTY